MSAGTALVALGIIAGVAAVYKILTSRSGSFSFFNLKLQWGR